MTREGGAGSRVVFVPEAQAIGMIGVIRSLGRAGYRVVAASARADGLGLASSYAASAAVHPPYGDPAFIPWLGEFLAAHRPGAIVPSEGFLLAARPVIDGLMPLLPDASSTTTLYRAFSKCDVESCLQAAGDDSVLACQPRALVVERGAPAAGLDRTEEWAYPLFVKTDGVHADRGGDGDVRAVRHPARLDAAIQAALSTHRRCLVQEAVPGVKATVNLWRHEGRIRAWSMCLALHENPHTGGLTSDRLVWWHQPMLDDACRRLDILDWNGVAMVEYRWDAAQQRFWFLELNARYWNALNLDLFSGKDFPRWQVDAHFGAPPAESLDRGPLGLRARYTVPAEVGHVLSKCRDGDVPLAAKLSTIGSFVLNGLRPSIRSDLWFPGDRSLYWRAWGRFVSSIGRPG